MPLKPESALRKDRTTGLAPMQHRHFATIATILRDMRVDLNGAGMLTDEVVLYFSARLSETNPNFDRDRFIKACER